MICIKEHSVVLFIKLKTKGMLYARIKYLNIYLDLYLHLRHIQQFFFKELNKVILCVLQ